MIKVGRMRVSKSLIRGSSTTRAKGISRPHLNPAVHAVASTGLRDYLLLSRAVRAYRSLAADPAGAEQASLRPAAFRKLAPLYEVMVFAREYGGYKADERT